MYQQGSNRLKLSLALLLLAVFSACGGSSSSTDSAAPTTETVTALQRAVVIADLAGDAGEEQLFTLEVPADQVDLTVTTSGGSGDVDLYVRHGDAATTTLYDCESVAEATDENCYFSDPEPGTYHILLHSNPSYRNVQLVADYQRANDTTTSLPGSLAYGDIPQGLPDRLAVGLMESKGSFWMRDSGVAWDLRYAYFTKDWRNNWGWDTTNSGIWGLEWMEECDQQGFIPAIQYYSLNDFAGGGEDQFYAKTTDPTTMAQYFDDFKLLMQRAKEFGKPVLVMLEADGYAYMQRQSGNNPDAYAAIADSGMSELSGLPNTVAGWGLAFLQLRKTVGADNVILGIHISAWASDHDIAYFSTDIPLQPEVDKVYAFLAELGLAANLTGQSYDLLVGDPLDRDADYYRITQGQDRWWDTDDNAPINSKSFNRYAEWMRLWNRVSGKRWVLWQIPLGNRFHQNVSNSDGPQQGYRDNRTEYFFAGGTAHLEKFADAGAIALLFGPGMGGQSFYTNDYDADGMLFLQSRAQVILNAGGVSIAATGQE